MSRSPSASLLPHHSQYGRAAEARACRYLRWQGWRIVARNWTCPGGELDIVASRWRTLLICEVRYRADGQGLASIDARKLRHLRRAIGHLVRAHRLQSYRLRLDIIAYDGQWRRYHQRDVLQDSALGE